MCSWESVVSEDMSPALLLSMSASTQAREVLEPVPLPTHNHMPDNDYIMRPNPAGFNHLCKIVSWQNLNVLTSQP